MDWRGRHLSPGLRGLLLGVFALPVALAASLTLSGGSAGASTGALPACTDTFTAKDSDAWEDPANWTAGVPSASTVACWNGFTVVVASGTQTADSIQATGGGGLTVTGGSFAAGPDGSSVGTLKLAGGSLDGVASLSGAFLWTGGTLEGGLTQSFGTFTIGGSGAPVLSGDVTTASPVTISNPDLRTVQASPQLPDTGPALTTSGTLTLGPGVTVTAASGYATFTAANVAANAGPSYGFDGLVTLVLDGGTTIVAAGTTLDSGSTASIEFANGDGTAGTTTSATLDDDGTIDGDVTIPALVSGTLEGAGTIDGSVAVEGAGVVSPGDPVGALSVDGDYTQSDGFLSIDIGGAAPASGYSQLDVQGQVSLTGAGSSAPSLSVADPTDFAPSTSDGFTVVQSPTAISGGFVNGISFGTGVARGFGVGYDAGDVLLDVVPANTSAPVLSAGDGPASTVYVGESLTCAPGTWTGDPTSFTYSFDGASVAPGAGWVVPSSDLGHSVSCGVTAQNVNGAGYGAYSASALVEAAQTAAAPTVVSDPAIAGTAVEGDTLVALAGSWSDAGAATAFQWLRCPGASSCSLVSGATATSYLLSAADVGATIEVEETASDAGGVSVPALSSPTAIVQAAAVVAGTPAAAKPQAPNTLLVGEHIEPAHHSATFQLKASGDSTAFECALVREPSRKGAKAPSPSYAPCAAKETFKHLKKGRYVLYARAVGPGGVDATPVKHSFKIT